MWGKRQSTGCGEEPKAYGCVHVYGLFKGAGSCSARPCGCTEGRERNGPSKGKPGVSAARALQQNRKLHRCCVISQITSANRCEKWGMKLESKQAPGCGNVSSAWLQRLFSCCIVPLGVWARWRLIHLLPPQKTHDEKGWRRESQTLFSHTHWQGRSQWAQIKPHEIPPEHRKTFFNVRLVKHWNRWPSRVSFWGYSKHDWSHVQQVTQLWVRNWSRQSPEVTFQLRLTVIMHGHDVLWEEIGKTPPNLRYCTILCPFNLLQFSSRCKYVQTWAVQFII